MMCSEKKRVVLGFTTILSIASFHNVHAASLVLQPDGATGKDAWVHSRVPTQNYGNNTRLTNNVIPYDTPQTNYGLIEFDISTVPAGAVVTSATLEVREVDRCDENINAIEIHQNHASWVEVWVNFGNKPNWGGSLGTNTGDTAECGWLIFDVKSSVQDWIDGDSTNYGFALTGPSNENVGKETRSSDYTTAADRPILRINYEEGRGGGGPESIPTMSVWGLAILASLLGIIGFRRRMK